MNSTDAEQLRHALLEALNARAGVALPARGLRRRVETELAFKITDEEVQAALVFLKDKELVTFDYDALGGTQWWRITAAGTLFIERA